MIVLGFILTLLIIGVIVFLFLYAVDPDKVEAMFTKSPEYKIQDEMSLFNDGEWVKKVIRSCKTTDQLWKAYKLCGILRNKYKNKVQYKTIILVYDEISEVFDSEYDKLVFK